MYIQVYTRIYAEHEKQRTRILLAIGTGTLLYAIRDNSGVSGMKIMKIRRVGNSNVVSLPRELEQRGYKAGTSVVIEELPTGELRIIPAPQMRQLVRDVGRMIMTEDQEALDILAEHEHDAPTSHVVGE
jgi:antitoxin component of MazEF toxin-antitoxin module